MHEPNMTYIGRLLKRNYLYNMQPNNGLEQTAALPYLPEVPRFKPNVLPSLRSGRIAT